MKIKTIWRIHSVLGLLAGLPLVIIAFSGSILVFKDEINGLLMPEVVRVEPQAAKLGLDARYAMLREQFEQDYQITGWAFYEQPDRSDFVYVVPWGTDEWLHVYQDPYTGEVLSEPAATTSDLMGWMLELHYALLAGVPGAAICGVVALLLCLLGVTGIWIYRKFWKHFFSFKWRSSWRMLAGNLHKRFGILSSPVFFILGLTGAVWNIQGVVHELTHDHKHEEVHEPVDTPESVRIDASFDALLVKSQDYIEGYELNYVRFPQEGEGQLTFYGAYAGQGFLRSPYNSRVTFESKSGQYLGHWDIREASMWMQVYDSFRPLHFGTFGGWLSRSFWCVLGFTPGLLALSGAFIWWRRSRK
ncbi:PepSY-associated TM helix domain-containing protein [Coraliomargarita parva]|uniref:PepSY-associated TM helix domain-containing protein n=1 Tax=Coraliomargarita parva TaxID=3014050 RepID=UPI0022B49934|nr:PepSY-associated TM helix domain-containing protein [Coraliomargarita parva]